MYSFQAPYTKHKEILIDLISANTKNFKLQSYIFF